jgi:DNA-binding CsgD family transcriptional regulator
VPFLTGGALLERERELATLHEGLERAGAHEGTLLLVEGPAGVGKTELGRETRAAALRAGMTVVTATGSELEQSYAFGVVRQLLEPVIGDVAGGDGLFAGGAQPAARLFDSDERAPASGDGGFQALHSLYWLVVNLADRAPLLVLVDDCQWADTDSLRFLSYLAQRIEGLPIAMVLAGRPGEPDGVAASLWSQIASRPSAVLLQPHPLSSAAATALARDRLGESADETFCRACHEATGGNPLFLSELLRGIEAEGVVPSAAAAAEVQAVGPAAVTRFVLHRLTALGPAATELARVVAVVGDDCGIDLAAGVAGLPPNAAREAADDLIRADIFARGQRLGFVHPVVRAALYEDLLPGERRIRHAAAADALSAAGAPAERVAGHLLLTSGSGDAGRIQILRLAAAAAERRGAPRAAAARLRRALAESPGEQERAEILSDLGRCEIAATEFGAAEEHLHACLISGATPETRAEAASTLGRCAIVSGGRSAEAAVAALGALADEIRPVDPTRALQLQSELLMVATVVVRLRADVPGYLQSFDEQARGHPHFEAVARIHRAGELLLRGGPAATVMDELEGALATGLPERANTGAGVMVLQQLRHCEQFDLALRGLDAALDRARREGHTTRQGLIHGQRAAVALAQGALHDAQVDAETGLMLVDEPHFTVLQLLSIAITVAIERGVLAEAAELAERGAAVNVREDHTYVHDFLVARGRLRIAQGQVREGVADLMWCDQRARELGVLWPAAWRIHAAPALVALGERERGVALAREQLEAARRVGTPGALGLSLRAAALAGGEDERLGLLEEAVSVLEESAARLGLAYALTDLGTELVRRGRRRAGRDAHRRALHLARECGAAVLAERAHADLLAGPGRPARVELTGRSALTAAEWRVCRQAASGRTNREIAEALFVTEKTVERHLSSAYHKLDIRSRFQLAEAIGEPRSAAPTKT